MKAEVVTLNLIQLTAENEVERVILDRWFRKGNHPEGVRVSSVSGVLGKADHLTIALKSGGL